MANNLILAISFGFKLNSNLKYGEKISVFENTRLRVDEASYIWVQTICDVMLPYMVDRVND